MKNNTVAQYMKDVLIENGFDSVMYGDVVLLDDCAVKCIHTNLMKLHPLTRHQRMFHYFEKSKLFKKGFVRISGMRGFSLVRTFTLRNTVD